MHFCPKKPITASPSFGALARAPFGPATASRRTVISCDAPARDTALTYPQVSTASYGKDAIKRSPLHPNSGVALP